MGIRDALRLSRSVTPKPDLALADVINLGGGTYVLESGTDVAQVASNPDAAMAFGINLSSDVVSRETAMTVPAIRRGRQVIAGTIGAQQLVAHRANPDGSVEDVTAERPLLTQPDPDAPLQWTLTWTVDDLVFYGVSWWRVVDFDPQGYPRRAVRVGPERIRVDVAERRVYVDGEPVQDRELIRFDGPDEGVLKYGGRTLRTAILLEDAVRKFARLDVPLGILKLAEGAQELSNAPGSADPANEAETRSEVEALLDEWELARATRTTAYLNRAIDYVAGQFTAEQTQLVESRQYQAAELARLMNLSPRYVNAPQADGMTYSTVTAERVDLVDTSLVGYITAVEQRLSMGDVTPRGTTVRLDLTRLLRGDTKYALEAARLAVDMGAMTQGEVRTDVLGRPPLDNPPAVQDRTPDATPGD